MEEEHLLTSDDLQGYFSKRISVILKKYGKVPVCWDDTLISEIRPDEMSVQYWNIQRAKLLKDFSDKGKFIYSDMFELYLDYPHSMTAKGTVTEHKMFAKGDPGSGWGTNEGRIRPFPMTFANCQTKDGKLVVYASDAEFTDDRIEDGYFGCAGVAKIPDLQNKLIRLARGGFKHHTSVGVGHQKEILKEAFTTYLHYDWVDIDI